MFPLCFRPVLNRLKKLLQDQHKTNVCLAIKRHAVPKVNSMLANVTMVMSLNKDLGINLDFSLSGDVAVTTNSLDVPFTGLVYHGDTRPAVPAAAVEPVFTDSTRMVYVGVSEDLFKSAAQALYSHGPLQLDLPQIGILPDYVLRTWGLPEGPVKVVLTEAPDVSISPDGVTVHVNVITQSLVNPDLPPLPLTCQVCIQVDLDGSRLVLQSLRPECTVEPKTLWGRFLATFVTSSRISSFIEELSADGFLLPLPDRLDLSQTKINYYPGFLVVGGDLVYPVQRSVLRAARLSPTSSRNPSSSKKFQSVVFLVIMVLFICLCKRCC
ncbi:bactericidal permeability-increasing protein-like [Etheostoma cragini]|uniref:bactericidal permeability-increasing protein-like n=1 Tax=Etheostoma cragini TaxID=417921 RepID=UPI00155F0571|nr:bactericidal permeability-increasing protein-like [Etheostoma cragini]